MGCSFRQGVRGGMYLGRIAVVGLRGFFPFIQGLHPAVRIPRTRCFRLAIFVRGLRDSSEGMVSCCRRECREFAGSKFEGGRFRQQVGECQFTGSLRCMAHCDAASRRQGSPRKRVLAGVAYL